MNTFTPHPHGPGKLLLTLQDPAQASPPLESLPYLYLPGPIRYIPFLPTSNILCMSLRTTFIKMFAVCIVAYLFFLDFSSHRICTGFSHRGHA